MMKRAMTLVLGLAWAVLASAMPSRGELESAQESVRELVSNMMEEWKDAGMREKMAASVKVGDMMMSFADQAKTEAMKFLLLQGAATFYLHAREVDKAADALMTMQIGIKNIPVKVLAEIIDNSCPRLSERENPRLFRIKRDLQLQMDAEQEVVKIAQQLKAGASEELLRRHAEALAVSGDWERAVVEFEKCGDDGLKTFFEGEKAGSATNIEKGRFWWEYRPVFEGARGCFRAHAASFFREAIDAGEVEGLEKRIFEQRLAEVEREQEYFAVKYCGARPAALADVQTGNGSPFLIVGNTLKLDLGERFGELEFVRCPAGKFKMLTDTKNGEALVTVSRPFWIMKTLLFNRDRIYRSYMRDSHGVSTEKDLEELLSCIRDKCGKYLSAKMVFRLPSFAEWEYAFHAATADKASIYYSLRGGVRDWTAQYERSPRNNWGIGQFGVVVDQFGVEHPQMVPLSEQVMDKLPMSEVSKAGCSILFDDGSVHYVLKLPEQMSLTDPFFWSEEPDAVRLGRLPQRREWFATKPRYPFRLVLGPDLVGEWKAKRAKQ